jgi:hypothetical protein
MQLAVAAQRERDIGWEYVQRRLDEIGANVFEFEEARATLAKVDREFGKLGSSPTSFQGGFIVLVGFGCRNCGNGFWTEGDDKRILSPGSVHPCPHCGDYSKVPA